MFNDRKANRFSNRKYRKNIINNELYSKWKETYNYNISFKEFKQYWKYIAYQYVEDIILETDGAKLGDHIGDLYIGYIPSPKKRGIDYKTSLDLGKTVYHENWNSNGKLGKIIYGTSDRKYIYRLHRWWSFKACTNFRKSVKKSLSENPERYKNSIEKRSLLIKNGN